MNENDVLAELRTWRDEFAKSHDYDLSAMCAVLREMDLAAKARVVDATSQHLSKDQPQSIIAAKQVAYQTRADID